jgi:hypothetical protein
MPARHGRARAETCQWHRRRRIEFYPALHTKVAVLGCHLAKNHPLPDGNVDMPARTPVLLDSVGPGAYDGQGALTPPWALPKVCQVLGEGPSFSRTLASSPLELRGATPAPLRPQGALP